METGDILYLQDVPYTDHPKYHLVISTEENIYFVINSDINNTVALNPTYLDCQVKIEKEPNHKFLTEDLCYIACHQIAPAMFTIEIETKLKSNKASIVGKLNFEDLKRVKEVVQNHCSLTLSIYERREIQSKIDNKLKTVKK